MKFPKIETVLIFKNGNCCIRKIVELPKNTNKIRTEMPSSCVHGTCWLNTDARIISLKSVLSDKTHEHTSKVTNLNELIRGNEGKEVILQFSNDHSESGILGAILGQMVILMQENKENYYNLSRILSVHGEGLNREFKQEEQIREIEVEYETEKDETAFLYAIMKKCSWAPSYLLTLDTEKLEANLKMQAVIINDSQNFFANEFICAAGAPKFTFQFVQDPFVHKEMSHEDFLSQLAGAGSGRSPSRYNYMPQQQQMLSNTFQPQQMRRERFQGGSEEEGEDEGKAGSATDYYYYKFSDISVEKGQRVLLPVFSQNMKYSDMYKCKLVHSPSSSSSKIDHLKATHIVKIKNMTKDIWTTGPCTIRSEKQLFAGQSTIYFTTPTVDSLIDIADALSIRVKYEESTKVNPEAKKRIHSSNYVQAVQECVAEVCNFQDKDIMILLERDFVGVLDEKSATEKVSKNMTRLNTTYQSSVSTHVEWEIKVEKGETKVVKFSYSQWVADRGQYTTPSVPSLFSAPRRN